MFVVDLIIGLAATTEARIISSQFFSSAAWRGLPSFIQ
jgi:hypothetical protein